MSEQPAPPRGACWALAAMAILAVQHSAAGGRPDPPPQPAIDVSVQQPRAFGYVIGDELQQRITLLAPAGFTLDPKGLPRAGRTGLWLELAPPRLTSRKVGAGTRYRLTLDYQIVNSPQQVRTVELPELDLAFGSGSRRLEATVEGWPITIAPITPTFVLARAGLQQMQPDAAPIVPDAARYRWLTLLWVAAIIAIIVAGIVQRRGIPWLRRGTQTFTHAARDLARLARLPADQATYRRGLQRLHRAFDTAAGQAVFGDHLAPLFAARPELLGLRAPIEQFYADSQREFFGARAAAPSLEAVLALARSCRDAERAAGRPLRSAAPASGRGAHAL